MTQPISVAPGTIALYSDIGCPWSHVAVHRWHRARRRLGLANQIRLDVRAFPLEIFDSRPTPKQTLDAESAVLCEAEPDAGWQAWHRPPYEYPVTTLPALEAVEAAKEQGLAGSEQLDRALRVAFFGASRCVSLRSVILEVADGCDAVDATKLADALDEGRARRAIMDQKAVAEESEVKGSPHFFLPDGSDWHNPGMKFHWVEDPGVGFPVIESSDPAVYDDMLRRAAG
jgi:predicted DsbA family dithiol-disulfide isomerase